MSKERLNVSVDPDVARQVREREDMNVSGAVNDYLKRRLMGDGEDDAMLQIKIERHEQQAEKHQEEADRHRQKAETLRRKLRKRQQERRESLREAIDKISVDELNSTGAYVKTPDEMVASLAEDVGVSTEELRSKAIERYQDGGTNNDQQRHYQ